MFWALAQRSSKLANLAKKTSKKLKLQKHKKNQN
jgi:hypothetical protein